MPTKHGESDLRKPGRHIDTSGKYANSAPPQWMKTLEDKYQKLHKKLLLSARLDNIRSNRNRIQTLKYGGIFKQSSIIPKSARTNISSNTFNIADSEETGENKVDENVNIQSGNTPVVKTDLPLEEVTQTKDETKMEEDGFTFQKETTFLSEGHNTQDNSCPTSMPRLNKNSCDPKVLSLHAANGLSVKVNMPNYRESNYTPRSCPAMIETLRMMGTPRLSQTENCRRGLRGFRSLNMFSKMSTEAQHAVSETLMEMGAEISASRVTESSALGGTETTVPSSKPLNEQQCTNSNTMFRHNDAQCKIESGIGRRKCHQVNSNVSCNSDSTDPSYQLNLPQLVSRTCHIENLERARLRVPGMGKYDVAMFREPTFQITPPDFDIRYRDVISCELRNSGSPPLEDIKKKAIEKCEAWLTKYSARW